MLAGDRRRGWRAEREPHRGIRSRWRTSGDRQYRVAEIVVIVRSAGSGGYLSAEAFTFDAERLVLRASVEGLPPAVDVIAALQHEARNHR